MSRRTRRSLSVVLAVAVICLFSLSGEALADSYLGVDWWVKVSTENVPWLNGSFKVAGYDRWGNHFSYTGNKIQIGRGPELGVFYVTGSTRLTLLGENFGSNFYPVSMSATSMPILDGGNIEISTDGKNELTIHIQNSPALGQVNTKIVFDGVSKAFVSNALTAKITSSLQDNGCSEIMTSYVVDGVVYEVPNSSQTIEESFAVWENFGAMGGGTLNAPSMVIHMSPETRSGYFQKDPSSNSSDDNVYLVINQPVSTYTVEVLPYGAKLKSDLSIELPCVSIGNAFYYLRFYYAGQSGVNFLWWLGEFYATTNNYSCIPVGSDLRLTIPYLSIANGVNYSAVLDYSGVVGAHYYWHLSYAAASPCNWQ